MLMCNQTVSLIHKNYDAVTDTDVETTTEITGASWFSKAAVELQDKGLKAANVIKVRIPAENMPPGDVPMVGDEMTHGSDRAKVLAVSDNRRGNLSHWAVTLG